MNGFQVTFFTHQNRRHRGEPVASWLLHTCKSMGLRGATVMPGSISLGHDGRFHSSHFFELADQPVEILVVGSTADIERLFAHLKDENVHLFYVKSAVEFGVLGE